MRVFRGKVVFLSGVEGKVVELDRSVFLFPTPTLELLVLGKDEFPLSAANRLELSGVVIIESLSLLSMHYLRSLYHQANLGRVQGFSFGKHQKDFILNLLIP